MSILQRRRLDMIVAVDDIRIARNGIMACVHLNQLYQLCRESQVHLSSTDLIHLVCRQCKHEEVCPSVLYEEYDAAEAQRQSEPEQAKTEKP